MHKITQLNNVHFTQEFEVRDYELDMLGMVNNAVFLNYLEHTRHCFLGQLGINFAQMFQKGFRLVVTKAEYTYKRSLQSGDNFLVTLSFSKASRVRFRFDQEILLLPHKEPVLSAIVIGTCLSPQGKPHLPDDWGEIFRSLNLERI